MKLLAFSDLHRDAAAARAIVEASRQADVVVAAGDFATKRLGIGDTIEVLRAIDVPTLLVAGNHDALDDLRTACEGWTSGHVLHGEAITIGGVIFFGLGFEISTVDRGPWNSQMSEPDAARLLAPCPPGAVLVTHAPAHGVADLQANGAHEGSTSIRATVEERQPRIHLCGHIHNAWGSSGLIGLCTSHNLGPHANWFVI
jgi:Icc-related predicted phosphoesterase